MVKMHINQTWKGTPYGVGVHVEEHSGGGRDSKRGVELTRKREVRRPALCLLVGIEE